MRRIGRVLGFVTTVAFGCGLLSAAPVLADRRTDATVPAWDTATGRLDPARFAAPPSTSRPHAFWFWNGKLTEAELTRQLDEMQGNGVDEFFIHPRQGLGGEFGVTENEYYLSTDYFDKVSFVVEQAKRRGMKAWLYDDLNWPSGFAGGRTINGGTVDGRSVKADPEFVPWYLTPVAADVAGPSSYDQPVPVAPADGKQDERLVAAVALPKKANGSCVTDGQARGVSLDGTKTVDLTGRVSAGRLVWDVPPGQWCLLQLVQKPLLNYHPDLEPDELYVDMLNPAATEKFIDITHETYARRVGDAFGTTIPGIFNDEPGFYNNFPDGRGGADSRGSIPWTPGFSGYLEGKTGYNLAARLAAIWYDVGSTTTSTRADYYDALSDRYNEAHTVPLADWADDHGIALISNPLVEEDLGSHKLIEGGSWFEMQRHYQLPGMDLIAGLDTSAITPKLNSSVAHLFNRPRNLAETFGAFGWDLTMEEMKRTVAWEAAGGVDLIDNHAFYYSIDGKRATESQPSEFFQNLFWPRFAEYAAFVGRLSEPARGATPVNPVGVLYPSSSVMATGTPWDVRGFAGNGSALGPVDSSWKGTSNDLLAAQLDFDYLDELALADKRHLGVKVGVDDGELTLHQQRWQALVLPRTTVLDLAAVRTMEKLVNDGGTVVAVEGLASNEAGGRDAELRSRLSALFGTDPSAPKASQRAHGKGGLAAFLPTRTGLADLVRDRIDPDVTLRQPQPEVRVRHVKRGADDAYLMVNLSGQKVSTDAVFDVRQTPELWDPETGQTRVAPTFRTEKFQTVVPLALEPYQALWVTFRPGAHLLPRTPHLTATNAEVEQVGVSGDDLTSRLVTEEPGEVYAQGEYGGRTFGGITTVTDSLEPVVLDGDWQLRFDRDGAAEVTRPLKSWTDLDPRYSGSGTYTKTFELSPDLLANGRRVRLDLGQVRDLAAVVVNDKPVQYLDSAPYSVDVTPALKPGQNTIAVTVTNTQTNAIEGNARASGLLGPVVLQPQKVVDLKLRRGQAVTSYDAMVSPVRRTVQPGETAVLTTTLRGIAPASLSGVVTTRVPQGWTVQPSRQELSVFSGGRQVSTSADVAVTTPSGQPEGTYDVGLTYTGSDGRTIDRAVQIVVARPLAGWEFGTDAEGWTPANQVTPFTVGDGRLSFSATGGDPWIVGPPVDLPLSGGLTVEVSMTSSTASGGQLFWATTDGGFSEGRSGRFAVAEGAGIYRVDIPPGSGSLRTLRLDPLSSIGDLAIDHIRVLHRAS